MKTHILSKYSVNLQKTQKKNTYETNKIEINNFDKIFEIGNTTETRTKEISDPDEFILGTPDSTLQTEKVENSDPDEFIFGPTQVTENVELSDSDEFVNIGPTKDTYSLEDSDSDEFSMGNMQINYDGDYDEILLI